MKNMEMGIGNTTSGVSLRIFHPIHVFYRRSTLIAKAQGIYSLHAHFLYLEVGYDLILFIIVMWSFKIVYSRFGVSYLSYP